jgi:4-hydroxy-tetrahydrodipicolinate reductase
MAGVTVFGITGRMGQALLRALRDGEGARPGAAGHSANLPAEDLRGAAARVAPTVSPAALRLSGAVASVHSSRLGLDAASQGTPTGVLVTADAGRALGGAAVAVDFSLPQCVLSNAAACVAARVPLLVAATGFDAAVRSALGAAAATIPILIAPNTSVGVNVMLRLVSQATRALGADAEVEIGEAHHRTKRDAPSGTALALGEAVARARGRTLAEVAVFERHGNLAPRTAGDIGFSVLRAGDIVGEHTVIFASAGERLEITHRATDRSTFARGALRAAAWLCGRPPGQYTMDDVLGDTHGD